MALAAFFLALSAAWGVDTPGFKPGFNLFSPQQDVQLGRERAEEVDRAYPLLADPEVLRYVNDLGRQLASLAPSNNAAYVWTFKVINSSDINAFLCPAGTSIWTEGPSKPLKVKLSLPG